MCCWIILGSFCLHVPALCQQVERFTEQTEILANSNFWQDAIFIFVLQVFTCIESFSISVISHPSKRNLISQIAQRTREFALSYLVRVWEIIEFILRHVWLQAYLVIFEISFEPLEMIYLRWAGSLWDVGDFSWSVCIYMVSKNVFETLLRHSFGIFEKAEHSLRYF